ncbi:hypothetical protein UFOVP256_8 [uncultured Caudovirales phage]|uniref:Uncharacterized protein n=1 Tax=uncultured Caudovirales phage TaxID=2100421 RepID=A0A6J5LE36_9CAUD|nr:hypothetical protein UFOVP256_8 [uncultured Caudovirales phage]
MEQDYTLAGLSATFSNHADMAEQHMKFAVEEYKKQFPDQEVPSGVSEQFNISRALCVICCELERLKQISGGDKKTQSCCI